MCSGLNTYIHKYLFIYMYVCICIDIFTRYESVINLKFAEENRQTEDRRHLGRGIDGGGSAVDQVLSGVINSQKQEYLKPPTGPWGGDHTPPPVRELRPGATRRRHHSAPSGSALGRGGSGASEATGNAPPG